jgi:proliferating cell nuclear antigen
MSESTNSTDSTDPEPAIRPVPDTEQTDQPTPADDEAITVETGTTDEEPGDESVSEPEHPADSVPDKTPQTFEAAIEASHLQQLLDIVMAVVEECRFHLGADALYIRAVDPANVAMTDIAVSPDVFETYDSSGGTIGLDLDRLNEVLGLASKGDLIQFALDPQTRKLAITIDAIDVTLALLNPQTIRHEPDLPELDLPATVGIEGQDIDRAVTAADMVADHLRVGVDPTPGCFRTEASGDTDDVRFEIDRADCELFESSTTEAVESVYSLEYLKELAKPLPADASITVGLGTEFPLDLRFDAVEETIDGRFLLAPRLESD